MRALLDRLDVATEAGQAQRHALRHGEDVVGQIAFLIFDEGVEVDAQRADLPVEPERRAPDRPELDAVGVDAIFDDTILDDFQRVGELARHGADRVGEIVEDALEQRLAGLKSVALQDRASDLVDRGQRLPAPGQQHAPIEHEAHARDLFGALVEVAAEVGEHTHQRRVVGDQHQVLVLVDHHGARRFRDRRAILDPLLAALVGEVEMQPDPALARLDRLQRVGARDGTAVALIVEGISPDEAGDGVARTHRDGSFGRTAQVGHGPSLFALRCLARTMPEICAGWKTWSRHLAAFQGEPPVVGDAPSR